MRGSKRPGQRDIARVAKVSQTVVSHVLNGKSAEHGIPKDTEERVRAAMDELGYVPNISAQALRNQRNGLIGVHTFETLFPTSQQSYYFGFMVGVEERAIESGQDLLLLTSAHQHEGDQDIYRGGRNRLRITDGAIILGFNQDDAELARLADEGFPFVFIGRREKAAALMPYVTADYTGAMRTVLDEVGRHGHRTVAYLGVPDRVEPRDERLRAARSHADRAGITICDETFADVGAVPADWLDRVRSAGATTVLVELPAHLAQVRALAADRGLDIPGDLSVVALDAPDNDQLDWTHVAVPQRAIGARAVTVLLELLDGTCDVGYSDELPCTFHPGHTLAGI